MKAIAFTALILLFLPVSYVLGQDESYSNLTVSGTATIGGLFDVQGNTQYFGAWQGDAGEPGAIFTYSEATGGTNAAYSDTLTRPGASWNWLRLTGSGTAYGAMELDQSNRLILTGTQISNPGSIVIDPTAGQITVNNQQVLTNGEGLSVESSGDVGIGTSSPSNTLDVVSSEGQMVQFRNTSTTSRMVLNGEAGTGGDVIYQANGTPLFGVYSIAAGTLGFYPGDGSAASLFIDNQNIGMGTTTPTNVGTITGINGTNFQLYDDPDDYVPTRVFLNAPCPELHFVQNSNGSGNDNVVRMSYNGNAWTVDSNVGENYGAAIVAYTIDPTTGALAFPNGFTSAGNIGIANTAPAFPLDVAGAGRFAGPVYLAPAGDLGMGNFTADPNGSQNYGYNMDMGGGYGDSDGGRSTLSGTSD